jgi:2-polyprenyl-3-methyl-5-hydroxy-6-metoxy-1,4-benzoquinol methylase
VNFETIACPACSSGNFAPEYRVGDRFDTIPGQIFDIVRCQTCGLLFVNPRPDASSIGAYYAATGYDPFGSSETRTNLTTRLYKLARPLSIRRKASRVVDGLPKHARTLDVGCATGEFMMELRRRNFEVFGVEPDSRAAEYAREKNGLIVWTGSIEQVPDIAGPFALITFWHVLEHVHRLKENLARAHGLLDHGGRLAIAVPNPVSKDARFYRERWVAWDAPRHLYHFEPRVMLELLAKSGFRPERKGAVAFDAFYHSILSEPKSVTGLLRGGCHGLSSYLSGITGHDGSSELYLAYKE